MSRAATRAACRPCPRVRGGGWWHTCADSAKRSDDGGAVRFGYRSDHASVAASISVLARRSGDRLPGGSIRARHQERDLQRAVLPGPFPAPAGDAGSHDHRGARASLRHSRVQDGRGGAGFRYALLFRRHRQCPLQTARRARRSAHAEVHAEARLQGNLEVRLPRRGGRRRGRLRRDHGGARNQGAGREAEGRPGRAQREDGGGEGG